MGGKLGLFIVFTYTANAYKTKTLNANIQLLSISFKEIKKFILQLRGGKALDQGFYPTGMLKNYFWVVGLFISLSR